MGETGPQLNATDLTRTFGRAPRTVEALGPLDLTVAPGEFVCLVGPSGCGKSTLLRIAAGLLRPSTGELEIRTLEPPAGRHDLPGLRDLRLEDGPAPTSASASTSSVYRGARRTPGPPSWLVRLGPGRLRARLPGHPLRRHAPARRDRPRPRRRARDPADGRAVRGPGRPAPHDPPGRAPRPLPRRPAPPPCSSRTAWRRRSSSATASW